MKNKLKTWLKRYLPAEIIGTLGAVIFPTAAALITDEILIIAFIGTWGENVGFYGTMVAQEMLQSRKKHIKD